MCILHILMINILRPLENVTECAFIVSTVRGQ